MRNTPQETAALIALIMARSELSRARFSMKTIKILAGRKRLKSAFVVSLQDALVDFDYFLVELDERGGCGVMACKALESAKPVTVKRFLEDEERRALKRGAMDMALIFEELKNDDESDLDEDLE